MSVSVATDSEHDGVGQLDVVDVDSEEESDQAWDDIRVVDIYRLRYRLEPIQQRFCMLEETKGFRQCVQCVCVCVESVCTVPAMTRLVLCWSVFVLVSHTGY